MRRNRALWLCLIVSALVLCHAFAEEQPPQTKNLPVTVTWSSSLQTGDKFSGSGKYTAKEGEGITISSGRVFLLPEKGGEAPWGDSNPANGDWKVTIEKLFNLKYFTLSRIDFEHQKANKYAHAELGNVTVTQSVNPPVPPVSVSWDNQNPPKVDGNKISAIGSYTIHDKNATVQKVKLWAVAEKGAGVMGFSDADFKDNLWGKYDDVNKVWKRVEIAKVPAGNYKIYAEATIAVGAATRYCITPLQVANVLGEEQPPPPGCP